MSPNVGPAAAFLREPAVDRLPLADDVTCREAPPWAGQQSVSLAGTEIRDVGLIGAKVGLLPGLIIWCESMINGNAY